jgi:diguanylate cyclase (GGDEF)-like protein/PAS domain S-box-containing protein
MAAVNQFQASGVIPLTPFSEPDLKLRAREQRLSLALLGAGDGLWDWDLERDVVFFSASWREMLGLDAQAGEGPPDEWLGRVHPLERDGLLGAIEAAGTSGSGEVRHEYRIRHADGTYRWVLTRGRAYPDSTGRMMRISGLQSDVTQRRVSEELLQYDAFYDGLTGLPNRALFMDRLGRVVERARRNPGYEFAVLFLDLDGFKTVNDHLGHSAGDQLLRAVGRRLRQCIRPSDTVARLGGDEFTILLEDSSAVDAAVQVTQRIAEALALPFHIGEYEMSVSASVGIAGNMRGYSRAEEPLHDADAAMYRAKTQGTGGYAIFDDAMHRESVAKLELQVDLCRALERDELRLQFQPIVSLASGSVVGFEALVRWQHPDRGLISPAAFLPLAEETGLIVPLGVWVLREACCQLDRWGRAGSQFGRLFVSVNLSGKQLALRSLRQEVNRIVYASGAGTCNLKLEITEGAFLDRSGPTGELLRQLGDLNVGLFIDDFGTGQSNLGSLRHFAVDMLKVDRSLIAHLDDPAKLAVVRAAVALANTLQIQVVAEGVETAEQLAEVRALGCGYAQGFFFSHPLDAEEADALLASEPRWLPAGAPAQ